MIPSRTGRLRRIYRLPRTREPLLCTLSWFPKQPTVLLPLRCAPASSPAGFQTARRRAPASSLVRALVGGCGAWPPTIAAREVNTVVPEPRSAPFILWHVESPTTARPVVKQASPVFLLLAAVRPLLSFGRVKLDVTKMFRSRCGISQQECKCFTCPLKFYLYTVCLIVE